MNKIKGLLYIIMATILMAACTDEEIIKNPEIEVEEGIPVKLQMSYNALMPQVVLSRAAEDTPATAAVENKGYGLHIFIFSETTGNLTGYKYVTQEEFRSNYSEFEEFEEDLGKDINENAKVEINTLTGKSRIYAVANCGMSNYNVPDLLKYLNDGSINEDAYLNGHETVTLKNFQQLTFKGDPKAMVNDITVNEDDMNMLMSGGYQRGEVCTIGFANGKGAIYDKENKLDTKPIIQLRRVLSKVKVSISLHSDNTTATFVPQNYSVYNIASEGMMLPQTDGVTDGLTFTTKDTYTYVDRKEVNYQVGNMIEKEKETDKVQTGAWFEVIIPENRQVAENPCTEWPMREDNTYSNTSDDASKKFTNAPAKGTYVVINGKYTDNANKRIANATYTVHLGDFSKANVENNGYSDFNLNRNWEYEYNVYIKNVSDIVVEAHMIYQDVTYPNEPSPGAEGTVIDFGTGQAFVVDSHYEAVVMKVTKADAYSFSTEVPARNGGKLNTEYITVYTEDGEAGVTKAFTEKNIQDYQHQWLEFVRLDKLKKRFENLVWGYVDIKWGESNATNALKKQMKDLKYEPHHQKGGNVPFLAYTFTSAPEKHVYEDNIKYTDGNTPTDGDILLKGVDTWLKDLMKDDDEWETENTDGREIQTRTYICFINEHYYIKGEAGVTEDTWQWNEYTNANKERYFNFLNDYYDSQDDHSKHLKVNYSIEQKAIWTFYNPYYATGNHYNGGNHDGNVRAYGVEYYSDEELFDEDCNGLQDRLSYDNQPRTTAPIQWQARWNKTFNICIDGCVQKYDNGNYKDYSETDGRHNSMNDMAFGGDGYANDSKPWPQVVCEDVYMNGDQLINKHYLHLAFVYRNRDLDRDGRVDKGEIRWYTPSINQYAGLWMGEGVLPLDAKLYHETSYANALLKGGAFTDLNPSEVRHYFSSTPGMRTFWGEEAFSFGSYGTDDEHKNNVAESTDDTNRPSFVRCIRTIISGQDGVSNDYDPDPYYVYTPNDRTFDLRFIDPTVLSNTAMTTEIGPHHERLDQNKASIKFKVGKYRVGQTDETGQPIWVTAKDNNQYIKAPTAYTSYAVTQQSERLYENNGNEINITDPNNAKYLNAPASYVEDGESGWRIPNHREFGLMMLESRNMEAKSLSGETTYLGDDYLVTSFAYLGSSTTDWLERKEGLFYDTNNQQWYLPFHSQDRSNSVMMERKNVRIDACRTHCSNPWYRRGYHARRNNDGTFIMSMHGKGFPWNEENLFIRPIKDL